MNTTTRRFPRTLHEAFPQAYPFAIERRRPMSSRVADVLFATAIGVLLAVALVYGWSL